MSRRLRTAIGASGVLLLIGLASALVARRNLESKLRAELVLTGLPCEDMTEVSLERTRITEVLPGEAGKTCGASGPLGWFVEGDYWLRPGPNWRHGDPSCYLYAKVLAVAPFVCVANFGRHRVQWQRPNPEGHGGASIYHGRDVYLCLFTRQVTLGSWRFMAFVDWP